MEPVKFSKSDESLEINVNKSNTSRELTTTPNDENQSVDAADSVERVESQMLGIAPKHIKEYEIKKPEEKEPSLLKMISNKIRGNEDSRSKSSENLSKLKEVNKGNK